ncbi:MAG: biopolymer transporter ExbD [Fusobacteria bacterium]|nr:biopolymer transporter ExbD [Fusobacteriota bacterium]
MKIRKIERRTSGPLILELTPLIDVVFLLLIFFMVSTTFVDIATGININLPEVTTSENIKVRDITVSIDEKSNIFINKTKVTIGNFENEMYKAIEKNNTKNIVIKADKNLDYGLVVEVMTKSKNVGARELNLAVESNEK